jgi:hypothetical protein
MGSFQETMALWERLIQFLWSAIARNSDPISLGEWGGKNIFEYYQCLSPPSYAVSLYKSTGLLVL